MFIRVVSDVVVISTWNTWVYFDLSKLDRSDGLSPQRAISSAMAVASRSLYPGGAPVVDAGSMNTAVFATFWGLAGAISVTMAVPKARRRAPSVIGRASLWFLRLIG